jgi:predicted transglutaminase-like cysteine proteinase
MISFAKTDKFVSRHRDGNWQGLTHVGAGKVKAGPSYVFHKFKKRCAAVLVAGMSFLCISGFSPAFAGSGDGAFLVAQRAISAPAGFSGLCAKYRWVCAPTAQASMTEGNLLRLAASVNSKVNRQTRPVADIAQYGREEYWALPTARGGDCEDMVLLKKKLLVERGVASESLLIATVLDRRLGSHAVLVLRTPSGDVVLDNLNKDIRPWRKTGYTFLKLQNPASLGNWHAVLAGGVIKEVPTASR